MIDWQASKEQWILEVRRQLLPELIADPRFPDAHMLTGRFEAAVGRWEAGGAFLPVIHDGNELAGAHTILKHIGDEDRLRYEARLAGTAKSIDFLVETKEGPVWIDFKTVAPQWQDDDASWERFERIAADFPAHARLVVDRAWSGAALSGQELKSRWSFIQRTVEAEQKAALLQDHERGPVWLLLCSNGAWHLDGLEDFADFYRTGRFREDDWSQNAIARYLAAEGIGFTRTLAGFSFLRRYHEEVRANHFVQCVQQFSL